MQEKVKKYRKENTRKGQKYRLFAYYKILEWQDNESILYYVCNRDITTDFIESSWYQLK